MNALWTEMCARGEVELTGEMPGKLSGYLDLLLEANEKMNLTRITDRAAAEVGHVGDSLTVLPFLDDARRLADIGSGGGLPGVPIAIVRPDLAVTLIDATQKKAAFLVEVARKLELPNVQVIAQRTEQLRGHQYDVVVTRALAAMEQLVKWCLPLVRPGGKLLAMKGPKVHDELPGAKNAIKRFRGEEPVLHDAKLPGYQHFIVEVGRRGG
jgi:16S rRNA (guanine527-N7)-methyltransferase